jgi:hypothetical protein
MKNVLTKIFIYLFFFLLLTTPAYAQSAELTKVESFIKSIIQALVTLSGVVAAVFIVWGGFGYITSSGNPENLERSKRTIFYSAIGLTITLGAYVISNIVSQLAANAFGTP